MRAALMAAALLSGLAASATRAQDMGPSAHPLWGAPLSRSELGRIRAGYLSADGVTFSFGVSMQTFINGTLALQSQFVADAGLAPPPAAALTLSGGGTQLLQDISPGRLLNVASTSASNQTIVQNTTLGLTLVGFQANQASYQRQELLGALGLSLVAGATAGRF